MPVIHSGAAKSHFVFQNGNGVVLREARNGGGVSLWSCGA